MRLGVIGHTGYDELPAILDGLLRLGDIEKMELTLTYSIEEVAIEGKTGHGTCLAICPAG